MALRILLACLLAQQMTVVSSWMDFPYGNDHFNYREQYLNNVTVECSQAMTPDNFNFEYWIRPDLVVMKENDYEEFWTLDGISTWQVSPDGLELSATRLNSKQFGFYYCVGKVGTSTVVVKKAINYEGPHFGNLWSKYRRNVIIGLSATAVYLALVLAFALTVTYCKCCQSKYKQPVREVRKSKRSMSYEAPVSNGGATNSYENIGMRHRGHTEPTPPYNGTMEDDVIEIRL